MGLNDIIQMVGVPASGKNTIADKVAYEKENINNICFSDILLDLIQQRGIGIRKKEIAYIGEKTKREIIEKGIRYVLEKQPAILNTHMVYIDNNRQISKTDQKYEYILKPKSYIHLTVPPTQIYSRIQKDKKRDRDYSLHEIKNMQKKSIETTKKIAKEIGSDFSVIPNNQGRMKSAAEKTIKKIDNIL